ncbi:hypothetical protein [Actinoplanes sp. NPDC026623]|uniref:hypothetical protein n=1 Tax=Actinoplanes sp. NPDC026623 TaxID=3155610 RepID=UPI0033E981BA
MTPRTNFLTAVLVPANATTDMRRNTPGSGEVSDADAADTPLYDRKRLATAADLLPSGADTAATAPPTGGEHQR